MTSQDRLEQVANDTFRVTIPPEKPIVYDIVIGQKLFPRIAADLTRERPASRYVIISDSNLERLGYVQDIENQMMVSLLPVRSLIVPAGEKSKSPDWVKKLQEELGRMGCNRDTMILALGGGVIGDLAGFVAGTYLRGIPFIDMPTTTLSQADSAIGGKKGVDLEAGKNLVGVFAQAKRVYIDLATLRTLDERSYRTGLVEGIKHGVIADREHFEFFERELDAMLERDILALRVMTDRNCHIKGTVVQKDPKEKGLRRILNYGHTAGHAVEKLSDYTRPHAECVAIGMNFAGHLAHNYGSFPLDELRRQNTLLERLGLDLRIPGDMTTKELIKAMNVDKKAEAGQIRFCLPKEIGVMEEFNGKYTTEAPLQVIADTIQECR